MFSQSLPILSPSPNPSPSSLRSLAPSPSIPTPILISTHIHVHIPILIPNPNHLSPVHIPNVSHVGTICTSSVIASSTGAPPGMSKKTRTEKIKTASSQTSQNDPTGDQLHKLARTHNANICRHNSISHAIISRPQHCLCGREVQKLNINLTFHNSLLSLSSNCWKKLSIPRLERLIICGKANTL